MGICRFSAGQLTRYDASCTLIQFASVGVKRLKFLISVIFRLGKKSRRLLILTACLMSAAEENV